MVVYSNLNFKKSHIGKKDNRVVVGILYEAYKRIMETKATPSAEIEIVHINKKPLIGSKRRIQHKHNDIIKLCYFICLSV